MPGAGITVHEQGVTSWQVVHFDRHRSQNGRLQCAGNVKRAWDGHAHEHGARCHVMLDTCLVHA